MIKTDRAMAYVCLAVTCVGWCLGPIFIRLLRDTYDEYTMPFVRYTVAVVPLLFLSAYSYRTDTLKMLRRPRAMFSLAAINVAAQYAWTTGTFGSSATTALLVSKVDVVMVVVLAYFLFREERSFITHPAFLGGAVLSFFGLILVMSNDPDSAAPVLDRATMMLVLTAVLWAVYSVWVKHIVTDVHPIPIFTVIALYTAIGYGGIAATLGNPGVVLSIDAKTFAVTVLSGVIPLSIAYPSFNFAQRHLGASFCSTALLFTPVLAYFVSFVLLPDEFLLPIQLVGALILIVGTLIGTVAHFRVQSRQASKAPAAAVEILEAG